MIQEIQDQKQWNNFLLRQPTQSGIFLQSWEWGEFQKAVGRPAQISVSQKFQSGRRVYRYQAHDGFAQVVELPLPLGKKYWFIPRGIVIDGLEAEARRHGVIFLRTEPIQSLQPTTYNLKPTRSVSPPQTLIIDLTKSEDELLAAMHEKTRYNIRLAQRKGVRCGTGDGDGKGFEEFWQLLQETAKRDKFRTHEREYYETMVEILDNPSPQSSPTRGEEEKVSSPPLVGGVRGGGGMHVRLHTAYHRDTTLAAAIVAYFGDTATYLHGASSYERRALMGPYALHWEIMQDAKARGYKFYDFWGVSSQQSPSPLMGEGGGEGGRSSWLGMTRFKLGFGGQVVTYPGTFDLPLNRFWYAVYRLGRFCRI